jgi:hypothetical protein
VHQFRFINQINTPEQGNGAVAKRRGLCLQTAALQNPCRHCEECIWLDQVPFDKGYEEITAIHALSGRHRGDGLEVRLDLISMQGVWRKYAEWDSEKECHDGLAEERTIAIDHAALSGFRQGLKDCGLLAWGERYEMDEGDGSEWVIRIQFDDLRVKKSGQNSYPRCWESFCQLFPAWLKVEFR